MNETLLKDALYNLSPDSGASEEYNRGLVVGIVSVMMATGIGYPDSIWYIARNLPKNYSPAFLPDAFREDIFNTVKSLKK